MRERLIKFILLLFLAFSILIVIHNFTTLISTQAVNVIQNISESYKFDINKATQKQLENIPGIGAKKASNIINYRNSKGIYKAIEDLDNVAGIGIKTIEIIKKYAEVK